MPIPTYDQFIEPILRFLASHAEGAVASEVHEAAASMLQITEEERLVLLPSGVQAVYKNRAGWAHDRLKRAGLSSTPRRGYWKLTERGFEYARSHPAPLSPEEVEDIATGHMDVRLRVQPVTPPPGATIVGPPETGLQQHIAGPEERLEQGLSELRASCGEDLIEAIARSSPEFFENLVLDLLYAMGYGTSRTDLQHVGRTGDGGIDGIVALDRLGLEKVYVQAKRWQGTVGRESVQAFFGALAGRHADKGVFITTSSFSPQALDYGGNVEGLVLIDGTRLAELMIEYGVAVTTRTIKVPKIDSDYFEE